VRLSHRRQISAGDGGQVGEQLECSPCLTKGGADRRSLTAELNARPRRTNVYFAQNDMKRELPNGKSRQITSGAN
jgi:hypothetical protein